MPIYEYRCTACQHTFEVMQKFSDRPVKKCPQCKGKVEKLLSAPGLLFKGSGWYVTDYARASKEGGKKESEPSGESKTEKSEAAGKSEKVEKKTEKKGKKASGD